MQVRLPADDYNPDGYTDVSALNKQWYPRKDVHGRTRNQRLAGGRGSKVDERGYWRPPSLPEAGDPDLPPRPVEELKWTLLCDSNWKVRHCCTMQRPQGHENHKVQANGHKGHDYHLF